MADNGWTNQLITSLVIPTGAGPTENRVVISGTDGTITSYNVSQNTFAQLADGSLTIGPLNADGTPNTAASSTYFMNPAGGFPDPNSQGVIVGPVNAGVSDSAVKLFLEGWDGSATSLLFTIVDNNSGQLPVEGDIAGYWSKYAESWTQVEASDLGSGWALGSTSTGFLHLQYRTDAEDNLVIQGTVHTTSTTPSSSLFTLDAAHRPKTDQRITLYEHGAGVSSGAGSSIYTSGLVTVYPVPSVSGVEVNFSCAIPLGNLS